MNIHDIEAEFRRLSDLLESGLAQLVEYTNRYAVAEDQYRMARASAYTEATGTVGDRQAYADLHTSVERVDAHRMDGMRQAALEAVRSRRQQISALQTLASAHRAEAEFARTGPSRD